MNRVTTLTISASLLCLLTLITGCRKVEIDSSEKQVFLNHSAIGFYPGGVPRFTYQENIHQTCSNPSRHLFRIQTNIQDTCMNIALENRPSFEGNMVMSDLDYYDAGIRVTDKFEFECSRISDGKMWLWDGYTKTGVIILRQ